MSRHIYDNWQKLVEATIRRECDRELAFCESLSSRISYRISDSFNEDVVDESDSSESSDSEMDFGYPKEPTAAHIPTQIFTFCELAAAMHNFNPQCLVSEGWVGQIYEGLLERTGKVDPLRIYNCKTLFTKIKTPLPVMINAILALDSSALDNHQAENLKKSCPTEKELEILKDNIWDAEVQRKCRQFFVDLMKVPLVESKLILLALTSQVKDLKLDLNTINNAAREVEESLKLCKLMLTILALGNALHQGTELAGKTPELLDFSKDLVHLEPPSKIQLKSLAKQMQELDKSLRQVKLELTAAEKDGAISTGFQMFLKSFFDTVEAAVRLLTTYYSEVEKNVDSLSLYFGKDPSELPFEQDKPDSRNSEMDPKTLKIYDNWERLVEATLKREQLRELAFCESFNTISSDISSDSFYEDVNDKPDSSDSRMDSGISNIYDNWERLVEATLKREQLRELTFSESFSSIASDISFDSFREDVDVVKGGSRIKSVISVGLSYHKPSSFCNCIKYLDITFSKSYGISKEPTVHIALHTSHELAAAKHNFEPEHLLREGESRGVYKGQLKSTGQVLDCEEFINQFYIPDYLLRPESEVEFSPFKPDCPVLVFINSSCGQLSGDLLITYRSILNARQVIDLGEEAPDSVLHRVFLNIEKLKNNGDEIASELEKNLKIIVAGGDGTAGWLLGVVSDLKLSHPPPIATVPLGTGNNLPFALGWGKRNPRTDRNSVLSFLDQVQKAKEMMIDSWHILMRMRLPKEGYLDPIPPLDLPHSMHEFHRVSSTDSLNVEGYSTFRGGFWSYFSMGMNARASYEFHSERKLHPEKFKKQLVNQSTYAKLVHSQGQFFASLLRPSSRNIAQLCQVKVMKRNSDWQDLHIPHSIRSIVCLNLPSFSGGLNPWGTPNSKTRRNRDLTPPYVDDGLIEIVGFRDAWQVLVLQARNGKAMRLAQTHRIRLEFREGAADHTFMSIDGEPWKQPLPMDDDTVVVEISRLGQVKMLATHRCRSKSVFDPSTSMTRDDVDEMDSDSEDEPVGEEWRKFGAANTFRIPDDDDLSHLS